MTTEHAASAPETAGALTLARSRHALYLFLASAGGTLALFMFIRGVRSGAIPTDFAIIFGYLLVALDYPAAMVSVVILVLAAFVPKGFPAARILRWLGEHPW